MADVERPAPSKQHRTRKPEDEPSSGIGQQSADGGDQRGEREEGGPPEDHAGTSAVQRDEEDRPRVAAAFIARRAAALVATLSGRRPESVVSIERADGGWRVGVEVVEVSRIPDSADILAVFEVRLDADGDLISYRRIRRYARGQLDWEHHR